MTGIDLLILALFALCAGLGAVRGWRRSTLDVVSLIVGLLVGLFLYPAGEWLLRKLLGLPDLLAGPLGFGLMIALGVVGSVLLLGRWAAREEVLTNLSRVGGALLSLLLGAMGMGPFLTLASVFFSSPQQVDRAPLARPFLAAVPYTYQAVELLGVRVPKVVMVPDNFETELDRGLPRRPQFRPINFTKLDGSTCIKCRGKMKFLGYQRKDGCPIPIPKFMCTQCGRTSDGCQGFESFHEMYHECPVTVAEKGYKLDCGVWTNGDLVVPQGPCPVCGKEYRAPAERPSK